MGNGPGLGNKDGDEKKKEQHEGTDELSQGEVQQQVAEAITVLQANNSNQDGKKNPKDGKPTEQKVEDKPYIVSPTKLAGTQAEKLRKTALAKAMLAYRKKPESVKPDNDQEEGEQNVGNNKEDIRKQKEETKIEEANESPTKHRKRLDKVSAIGGVATGGLGVVASTLGASATATILSDPTKAQNKHVKNVQKTASIVASLTSVLTGLLGMKKFYDAIKMAEKPSYASVSKKIFAVIPAFLGMLLDGIAAGCAVSGAVETFDKSRIGDRQGLNNTKNVTTLMKQVLTASVAFAGAIMHKSKMNKLSAATAGASADDARTKALLGLQKKSAAAHEKDWIDFGKMIPSIITQAVTTVYSWKDKTSRAAMKASSANGFLGALMGTGNTVYAGVKMGQASKQAKKKASEQTENTEQSPLLMVQEKIDKLASDDFIGSSHPDYYNDDQNIPFEIAVEKMEDKPDIANDYHFIDAYLMGVDADIDVISKNSPSKKAFRQLVQLATGG